MARKQTRPSNRPVTVAPIPVSRPKPAAKENMPNIAFVRPEVSQMAEKWTMLEDCLAGQQAVKSKRTAYLPMPRVGNDKEQADRYAIYIERAVFYNATRRTLDGLMGEVFSRDPVVKLPEPLMPILQNLDGAGSSAKQIAKKGLSYLMSFGRAGLLADYPRTEGPVTVAQKQSGDIRPIVTLYPPQSIINWRTEMRGARRIPTMITIAENYVASDDGFEVAYQEQYIVLRIQDGIYVKQWWRKEYDDAGQLLGYIKYDEVRPTDGNGAFFTEIPFCFAGCIDNNEFPDQPPLADLAVLNIGHYRNSADYEEACFIAGQPTAYFSGLTESWVKDVFANGQVYLGSRAVIPLPVGGQAGLLQVSPNSMPKEAMEQKERQMAAIGAKLIDKGGASKTLGEAQLDQTASSSILAAAANNMSDAMTQILRFAVKFDTGTLGGDEVVYNLNTDFPSSRLTPNERAQLVLEWQSGAITFSEMRAGLRRAGVASEKDDVAKQEGEEKLKLDAELGKLVKTDPAMGGTNQPKLNEGNGGGNQAGS